ncbi:MAG: hypothetical protein FIA97_01855 [Methylococcaceae bacterium]|nr:hypothetical protein [Methylococcaceae bacterium]
MLLFDIHALWSNGVGKVRGGVHPEPRKEATEERLIDSGLPLPAMLYLSLQQHVGQPAEPVVQGGDRVRKGQLLAASQGLISAPIHAPTSGVVSDIMDYPAAHPSALPTPTLLLEPDGEDRWIDLPGEIDPFSLAPEEIGVRVGAAGASVWP